MFPKSADVQLHAAPNGVAVGKLARAVVNTWDEICSGGWTQVVNADGTYWVRLDDLTYAFDETLAQACIANYEARRKSDFGSMNIALGLLPSGTTEVRLRICPDDDHVNLYGYNIVSGTIVPLEMYSYFGPSESLAGLEPLAIGAFAAFATLCATLGVLRVWMHRSPTNRCDSTELASPARAQSDSG